MEGIEGSYLVLKSIHSGAYSLYPIIWTHLDKWCIVWKHLDKWYIVWLHLDGWYIMKIHLDEWYTRKPTFCSPLRFHEEHCFKDDPFCDEDNLFCDTSATFLSLLTRFWLFHGHVLGMFHGHVLGMFHGHVLGMFHGHVLGMFHGRVLGMFHGHVLWMFHGHVLAGRHTFWLEDFCDLFLFVDGEHFLLPARFCSLFYKVKRIYCACFTLSCLPCGGGFPVHATHQVMQLR